MNLELTGPQYDFVAATEQFPALVAGFGAGKTHAGIWRTLTKKFAYPALDVAYYLPTYDLVARTAFPRFAEVLSNLRMPHVINKNEAVLDIAGCGKVIFRTMDNPARIVAFEVADSMVDELDTLPTDKARDVWNRVISRNRQKKPDGAINTVGVATTPEGYRFVYDRWQKNPVAGYRLIRATTDSNAANLPAGYIDSLRASYPSALLAAYLDGQFVNLTAGTVYSEFDRALNASAEHILPEETLHIGMDFNVGKMVAVVHVLRGDDPHAVEELTGIFDTPAMIRVLHDRYAGHPVMIYPDASGRSRDSNNASQTDISLLAQHFRVCANNANPAVKDRILAVNRMIHQGDVRRYRVNVERCPQLVESLEKQSYDKNGEPDKSNNLDHVLDAIGYFIVYRYPLIRRVATVSKLMI